jgi:uncharacterized membrane protein
LQFRAIPVCVGPGATPVIVVVVDVVRVVVVIGTVLVVLVVVFVVVVLVVVTARPSTQYDQPILRLQSVLDNKGFL